MSHVHRRLGRRDRRGGCRRDPCPRHTRPVSRRPSVDRRRRFDPRSQTELATLAQKPEWQATFPTPPQPPPYAYTTPCSSVLVDLYLSIYRLSPSARWSFPRGWTCESSLAQILREPRKMRCRHGQRRITPSLANG